MANKQNKRYELRSISAEEEEDEMEQPTKESEQTNMRTMMEAIMAKLDQQNDKFN